ncbi:MAG: hypothetical protein U9N34_07715 [Candidatus Cloacimonadota bacterium]|nr:hypothetical protein [Candidatus Cloacimonadota bacterium]
MNTENTENIELNIKMLILEMKEKTMKVMEVKTGILSTVSLDKFDASILFKNHTYFTNENGDIPYSISKARREDIREYRREEAACGNI